MGGVTYPSRPWNLEFRKKNGDKWEGRDNFLSAYLSSMDSLGFSHSTEANGITRDQFANGWSLFTVEILPSVHTPMLDMVKNMSVTLKLDFSEDTPAGGLYCLIFLEMDSKIEFDSTRTCHVESLI